MGRARPHSAANAKIPARTYFSMLIRGIRENRQYEKD
jgi:hypothetical protein